MALSIYSMDWWDGYVRAEDGRERSGLRSPLGMGSQDENAEVVALDALQVYICVYTYKIYRYEFIYVYIYIYIYICICI